MSGVVGSLWGLLTLAFIVAAFGIANTLTMNVLEQTREIAILRVLGMSRGQVRKMVLSQAIIMGTMGLITGLLAGLTTVYVINLCMLPLLGHSVEMTIRPVLLLGCFAAALAIVLLAAWMPAETRHPVGPFDRAPLRVRACRTTSWANMKEQRSKSPLLFHICPTYFFPGPFRGRRLRSRARPCPGFDRP